MRFSGGDSGSFRVKNHWSKWLILEEACYIGCKSSL